MSLQDPNHQVKVERYPDHRQWTTGITTDLRVYIQDDNFTHDARLYIDGDFLTQDEKLYYAACIAKVLNESNQ